MDGRFLKAFSLLPRQRTVCGRPTLPICLRHRLLLTSIDSPFVDGQRVPTPTDIVLFSRIVSTLSIAEATAPADESDAIWVSKMTKDIEEHVRQLSEAHACIEEQGFWPVFWKKDKSASKGVPWVLNVICNMTKNGVPLETAWTMPESQAIWMSSTFAIAEGADIDIVSDEDLAMMEFAKRLDEEAALKEAANV